MSDQPSVVITSVSTTTDGIVVALDEASASINEVLQKASVPNSDEYEQEKFKNYRDRFPSLNEIADTVYQTAKDLGFHEEPIPVSISVANLHSEVSELWESYRNNTLNASCDKSVKMKSLGLPPLTCLEEELADIIIRALDTAREHGIDIATAVSVKDLFNSKRSLKNGGKAAIFCEDCSSVGCQDDDPVGYLLSHAY